MQMTIELAGILGIFLTLILQGFYIAFTMGKFSEKLLDLEKKQDKHNNLIERMVKVESSTTSAHHRLDEMEHNCHKVLRGRLKNEDE